MELVTTDTAVFSNPSYALWNSIHYRNKLNIENWEAAYTRIMLTSEKTVELVLLDENGTAIESLKRKITPYRDFISLKPKLFLLNRYFLINGFASEVAALTLTEDEDLMLLWGGSGGVFLILFPIGGTTFSDSFEYRKHQPE